MYELICLTSPLLFSIQYVCFLANVGCLQAELLLKVICSQHLERIALDRSIQLPL